ncbi:MAG: ribonuclease inhibitor [Acidobacteria bacterium]|nr:ribonuclease inhibitor [Acidobacteriota bacterium]
MMRRRSTWGLSVVAVAVAAVVLADPRDRAEWFLFLGRFHPLVVHLPIGGLLVAALLTMASRRRRFTRARGALFPVLAVSAGGAVLAVGAGQVLAIGGAYAGSTFVWHRALGYLVALVAVLAAASAYAGTTSEVVPSPSRRLQALTAASVLLLLIAGHLGGTLTRGPGYLTEYMPRALRLLVPLGTGGAPAGASIDPRQVVAYTALVAPILQDRCGACHGPDQSSGGLRLDTPEHIRAGGSSGQVVIAGQAAGSELVRRLWLPLTDPDAMPPKGRPPISVADANLLRWWVAKGASYEQTLADLEIDDEVKPAIEARVGTLSMGGAAILALDVPPIDDGTLDSLVRHGLPVSRLAEDANLLQVQGRAMGSAFGDAEVQALLPVATQVTWLDVGGTAVTDAALAAIARFPHLSRLHLDRTAVTDGGLGQLRGLDHLEYINLYGTAVTDAGLEAVVELPRLRTVYVWQTAVTDVGLAKVRAARPTLRIETGLDEKDEK